MVVFYNTKDVKEKFYRIWEECAYFVINGNKSIWTKYLANIKIKKICKNLFAKYNYFKTIKNKVRNSFINKNLQSFVLINSSTKKSIYLNIKSKNFKVQKKNFIDRKIDGI